jgi:hypothetical protein
MFTHPCIANQPACQRQREILAQADQQHLLRFVREHARASRRAEQAGRRITRLLKHTRPAALPHEPHRSCQQPSTSRPVMTTLCRPGGNLYPRRLREDSGGLTGVVAVAIRREDRNLP